MDAWVVALLLGLGGAYLALGLLLRAVEGAVGRDRLAAARAAYWGALAATVLLAALLALFGAGERPAGPTIPTPTPPGP